MDHKSLITKHGGSKMNDIYGSFPECLIPDEVLISWKLPGWL